VTVERTSVLAAVFLGPGAGFRLEARLPVAV